MQRHYLTLVVLSTLLGSCATQNQKAADDYAKVCHEAEARGAIYLAEEKCEQAWNTAKRAKLKASIQSEKLYNIARIKRQLNKFIEAEHYIQQALEIEQTVSGRNSPDYALRLIELSLSVAGQGDIAEAAIMLEPVLNAINQFSALDKKRSINVLKYFAAKIKHSNQQLSARFQSKIEELQ